jgi:hypothetical protein
MSKLSRRQLLKKSTLVVGSGFVLGIVGGCPKKSEVSVPEVIPSSAQGANERIGVGIIGCGRRNGQLVIGKGGQGKPPKEAKIVAVADVNLKRAHQWAEKYKCPAFQD